MTISGAEWWGLEARARAWPEWLTLRDPWSGDEAILWPSEFSTVVPGGPLDAHQHDRADALFVRVYRAWLDGDCDWGSVHEAARARGVCQPIRHD
ncbi:MAG: hypothetical protein QGG40_21830, partial [Myxococcota bacterium]|nr:hypothetical protein [Myxococcota bacterium]